MLESPFFRGLVLVHVVLGFVGLVSFWVPVFARKGARLHVLVGKVFAVCAYVVTVTAIAASSIRFVDLIQRGVSFRDETSAYGFPIFLGYLGLVTFASVHHGLRVIATKRDPKSLRTPFHHALGWASVLGSATVITIAVAFWSSVSIVLLALSPVGILVGRGILDYLRHEPQRMDWFFAHMAALIGTGIAFHTAFAVFGAQRLFEYSTEGPLGFLPRVLPAAIGIPGNVIWERHYRRKFGLAANRRARGQAPA